MSLEYEIIMAVQTPIGENIVMGYPYSTPNTGHQSDMPYTLLPVMLQSWK